MPLEQLSLAQNTVAESIVQVGRYMGATDQEIVGALSAAWAESRLNPQATGDSGKAVGVFQQHPSYGTVEQRRDVFQAARAFFTNLFGTRSTNLPIAERVANVQRPATEYRGIYGDSLDEAYTIYTQLQSETQTYGSADTQERSLLLRSWDDLDAWLRSLGINVGSPTIGQTTGGTHAAGSYHYSGLARDYGSTSDKDAVARALVPLAVGPDRQLDELYYSPLGIFYDNGQPLANPSSSLVAGHQDHVHAALRGAGASSARALNTQPISANGGAADTPALAILRTIDDILNDAGGLTDPVTTARMVVSRGAVALGGLVVVVFGFVLVVSSIGKTKIADVASNVPGPVGGAATVAKKVA